MKGRWLTGGMVTTVLAGGVLFPKIRDARYVSGIEAALNGRQPLEGVFTVDMIERLPDPAKRYFLHSIAPGTPLANRLRWSYTGEMKPGENMPWMSISARQVIVADRGFLWKVRARRGPFSVTGTDHYLDGCSRMRIQLFGVIPVVNASDEQVKKSAMGRLLIERFAIPSSFLPGEDVVIEAVDDSSFRVVISHRGESTAVTLTVDEDGRLQSILMPRWGNLTRDGSYQYIPYGATVSGDVTFGGYTIPTHARVGWHFGTSDYLEVVRLEVQEAQLD